MWLPAKRKVFLLSLLLEFQGFFYCTWKYFSPDEAHVNKVIHNMRKPTMWILTRSDTNQAVQPLEMARGLKFCIWEVEALYYPSSENKGADQLRGYREADLRLCFRICRTLVFSWRGSCWLSLQDFPEDTRWWQCTCRGRDTPPSPHCWGPYPLGQGQDRVLQAGQEQGLTGCYWKGMNVI